jgi:hypothetical protein
MINRIENIAKQINEGGKATAIESMLILSPLTQEAGDGQRAGLGQ